MHSKPLPVPEPAPWCDRRTVLGLAWLIGFCLFFSSFDLPNNRPATRWLIWQAAPWQVLDIVWPLPDAQSPPSGWPYLLQRVSSFGIALLVLGAAIGFGTLAISGLNTSRELSSPERLFFASGVGLSLWSLITLGLGLAGCLLPNVFWSLTIIGNLAALWMWRKPCSISTNTPSAIPASAWLIGLVLAVCVPMIWAIMLGACTPQTDFDVVEYHLNGPKEWFQQGRITFLPHNVYTSFPFLTEMLLLLGMVLGNAWHDGALAGQIVLSAFAPLTALGLYCACCRWFSPSAGWLAALIFLTTPWTYRISIIAYAEGGLSYYILASFLAAAWMLQPPKEPLIEKRNARAFLLTGFLAGSGMACKYPGLTSVVIPIGLGIAVILLSRRVSLRVAFASLFWYGLGVVAAVGPWLGKNFFETGNPVYPLLYAVFGGRDFDAATNVRWVKAHAAPAYASFTAFGVDALRKFADIIANNDWHSPLLYGLAPLSLCRGVRRNVGLFAWLYLGWLSLAWFLLTHHIDRFWVPMIPIAALLAGAGAASLSSHVGKLVGGAVIAACIAFNVTICSLVGGYNAGLTDLRQAEQIAEKTLSPELHWLNEEFASQRLPKEFKLLCVGEAATFHAKFPVIYHTVFDECRLEEWCADGPGPEFSLKSAEEIRAALQSHGITHVFVNWREILRYREPGSYGYTDFVHPDRLRRLQEIGILGPAMQLPPGLGVAPMNEDRRKQLTAWAPVLILKHQREPAYLGGQIFPVR